MDALNRQLFIQNTHANYSVIAPAGVGKTQAIVDRIIAIASQGDGPVALECLVIVTYTRKAALELQVRAREGMLRAGLDGLIFQSFNKAFFGTIHSFCLELIQEHGPHRGLSGSFKVLEPQQEKALWGRFLQQETRLTECLPEAVRGPLLQCVDLWDLLDSVLDAPKADIQPVLPFAKKILSFEEVMRYVPENKRTQAKIKDAQKSLQDWLVRFNGGEPCLGLPEDYTSSDPDFSEIWSEALFPLKEWVAHNSLVFIQSVKQRFFDYQIDSGVLSYENLILLAHSLLRDDLTRAKIREHHLCVILDEAQDATSDQLEILLGVAGVVDPGFRLLAVDDDSGGRFCMVGDPQQSIYGQGSDLPRYLKLHRELQSSGWVETLQFSITFRCDEAIVGAVNTFFPQVLTSSVCGQVDFEVLEPRPDAGSGQVILVESDFTDTENLNKDALYAHEARSIAQWVCSTGLQGLRARGWEQVALLAPRNDWIPLLRKAFEDEGFSCQDHTRNTILADNPTYAWLCALVTIMDQPWNSFELIGVLREVFGIKDTDIACFTEKKGPLTLDLRYDESGGALADALILLKALRERVLTHPLRKAVATIMEAVDMPSRLAMLDGYSQQALFAKRDELLAQASLAEEAGLSLGGFGQMLRERLDSKDLEVSIHEGKIQLISCHSAKGLQWDAVILPFFYREIAFNHASYPQIESLDATVPPVLVLDKNHKSQRFGEQIRLKQRQELERLLYVAATRAKHTLVFAGNASFNKTAEGSFADILKVLPGQRNHSAWAQVSKVVVPEMNDAYASGAPVPGLSPNPQIYCDWALLRQQADAPLKRVIPSSLVHADTSTKIIVSPRIAGEGSGAEYGIFWHKAMETAPWSLGREAFQDHCLQQASASPDSMRFESEVVRFLCSSLATLLLSREWVIVCEMPFLWRSGPIGYEGVMDLVATHSKTGELKVIDWKTDVIPQGATTLDFLKERYSVQLDIYQKALSSWKKRPVEGILYSTRLGASVSLS